MEQESMLLRQMNDDNMAKVHQYEEIIERLHQDIENLRNTEVCTQKLYLKNHSKWLIKITHGGKAEF